MSIDQYEAATEVATFIEGAGFDPDDFGALDLLDALASSGYQLERGDAATTAYQEALRNELDAALRR